MSYPKIVALDTDWTIWQGWLDHSEWGKSRGASALAEDNIQQVDRWVLRDKTNYNNSIRMYNDISNVVNDIAKNGAKLAIVSRNASKTMCDKALYYYKAVNSNGSESPILQMLQYDEIVNQSKVEHFKRIKGSSGSDYSDMLMFDDEAFNNIVRVELGVTFQLARDRKGLLWDVYQQGLDAWRRVKQKTTIPSSPGFVPQRMRIGYSGLPTSWIDLVRNGEGTVDPKTPFRWGYALYVADSLPIAKYFCDWNNNWNTEKSYPCEVWVKDYDTWKNLNKVWIPEHDGSVQQMNNMNWTAEQTGKNQEDRDLAVARWGVQTPYVLFSQHHWMKGMPAPQARWTEMVVYTQIQRSLFEVVPLSDAQTKEALQSAPRPYPFEQQMNAWGITIPAQTKAEFWRYGEKALYKLATTPPTTIPPPTGPRSRDVIGFGPNGVVTMRNILNPSPTSVKVNDFGLNAGGWRTDRHVRLVGDVTGNGKADIVGFGDAGVLVSINDGTNLNPFSQGKLVLNDFAYSAGGWRVNMHPRMLADVRGTGRCDIVGFGYIGVLVALNNGGGTFGPGNLAVADFGYNSGWRIERHCRFLADVTGDGKPDIVGFGESHVLVGRNNGNGTFSTGQAVLTDMCIGAGGWSVGSHPRFVQDLTSNGKADLLGCGDAGVLVALNNGSGGFGKAVLAINDFGIRQGWKVSQHPRFVADLTGNKCGDMIGFGHAGVYVALNKGNGTFQQSKLVIRDLGVQQGWSVQKHLRFVTDLTGDGCADIIGFGDNSVFVSLNDGKGNFGPVKVVTNQFTANAGWSLANSVRELANLG